MTDHDPHHHKDAIESVRICLRENGIVWGDAPAPDANVGGGKPDPGAHADPAIALATEIVTTLVAYGYMK